MLLLFCLFVFCFFLTKLLVRVKSHLQALAAAREVGKELKLQLALETCRFLEINDIKGMFMAYLIFHKWQPQCTNFK